MNYDLTDFDPKAPPKKTEAFWEIADSNRSPEDSELSDCVDRLDNPDVLTVDMIIEVASPEFAKWIKEPQNRKKIASRMESARYVLFPNTDSKDNRWTLNGKKVTIYSKKELSVKERHNAVNELIKRFSN